MARIQASREDSLALCSLRRVCCQADGLVYASTLGWMRVEPQQRDAHPTEDRGGSMNLPTSVAESVNSDKEHFGRVPGLIVETW
jgi:hypothetical protein